MRKNIEKRMVFRLIEGSEFQLKVIVLSNKKDAFIENPKRLKLLIKRKADHLEVSVPLVESDVKIDPYEKEVTLLPLSHRLTYIKSSTSLDSLAVASSKVTIFFQRMNDIQKIHTRKIKIPRSVEEFVVEPKIDFMDNPIILFGQFFSQRRPLRPTRMDRKVYIYLFEQCYAKRYRP